MEVYKRYIMLEKDNFLNSNGLCDLEISKSFINLEKVKITTNLNGVVKSLKKRFTFELFYEGIKMKRDKILGEGDFGKIYLYKLDDNFLAIKINHEGVPILDDIISVKKYLPTNCRYSIIPLKIIKDYYNNPFLIMQLADGDLSGKDYCYYC